MELYELPDISNHITSKPTICFLPVNHNSEVRNITRTISLQARIPPLKWIISFIRYICSLRIQAKNRANMSLSILRIHKHSILKLFLARFSLFSCSKQTSHAVINSAHTKNYTGQIFTLNCTEFITSFNSIGLIFFMPLVWHVFFRLVGFFVCVFNTVGE